MYKYTRVMELWPLCIIMFRVTRLSSFLPNIKKSESLKVHFVILRCYFYDKIPVNSDVAFENYARFPVLHLLHMPLCYIFFIST